MSPKATNQGIGIVNPETDSGYIKTFYLKMEVSVTNR